MTTGTTKNDITDANATYASVVLRSNSPATATYTSHTLLVSTRLIK